MCICVCVVCVCKSCHSAEIGGRRLQVPVAVCGCPHHVRVCHDCIYSESIFC